MALHPWPRELQDVQLEGAAEAGEAAAAAGLEVAADAEIIAMRILIEG